MFFVAPVRRLVAGVARFLAVLRGAPQPAPALTVESLCAATLRVPAALAPLWTPAVRRATSPLSERAPPLRSGRVRCDAPGLTA
ncbi:hypothetical protein [Allorhizocola rhizosphaerae]|uniref:hypothetical protein n=1 Tax=Allorhizocola rhizosphaerae TaxID=1872709 RepID=UPI0013C2D300|nr:hypothetical protein [Allorhizocola rhizosphaerae]